MPKPETGEPSAYSRRVLVVLVGLSPQVVTETIYALVAQWSPPFRPTAIHLITTAEGARRLDFTLFDTSQNPVPELAQDLDMPDLPQILRRRDVHVLADEDGVPLRDIASARDNTAAADFVLDRLRAFTADPQAAVHVSIAGGRKTLSFLGGYALSMLGRAQDRLSHVLVSEPFNSHPQFFFPPRQPRVLLDRDNTPIRTDEARLELATIPFVRLRDHLPAELREHASGFSEAVGRTDRALRPASLYIDLATGEVRANGMVLSLPPLLKAWLALFAKRRREGEVREAICWRDDLTVELLDLYGRFTDPAGGQADAVRAALRDGMTKAYFEEKKARLTKALRHALGAEAPPFLPEPVGRRPETRFRLPLSPDAITFADNGRWSDS